MILSHKYKYIFLKTNKTAGTSVEIALSKYCGDEDIIAGIAREDEKLRQDYGGRGPQNHLAPAANSGGWRWLRKRDRAPQEVLFYNHMKATEVKEKVGERIWNEYFKFCIERNPWDRMISLYYFRNRTEPRASITEFLRSDVPMILKRNGFGVYTIQGDVVVDRICRYENLDDDLEEVRLKLGMPETLALPRAKSSYRKDRRSYRELLSDEEAETIRAMFQDELSLLGYEY